MKKMVKKQNAIYAGNNQMLLEKEVNRIWDAILLVNTHITTTNAALMDLQAIVKKKILCSQEEKEQIKKQKEDRDRVVKKDFSDEFKFGGVTTLNKDPVNHPLHYNKHPSGIECIQITEHMGFNLGNAVKYIWRADEKGNAVEDLKKALWYIERELNKRFTNRD